MAQKWSAAAPADVRGGPAAGTGRGDPAAQCEFFESLAADPGLFALFDALPGVYCYVKDAAGRLVKANRALVALRGCRDEAELLGRTDFDLHPRHLAERYAAEDRRVVATGRPLADQVWLIPERAGTLRWYLSTKVPLFGKGGTPVGVAGLFRDLRGFDPAGGPDRALDGVLRRVLDGYAGRIEVPELAASVGLSVSQFDRRFKAAYGMSPREYLLRVRVDAAAHLLVATRRPAARIAAECGFYDQSSFGKRFRARTGLTPAAYRRRYAAGGAPAAAPD